MRIFVGVGVGQPVAGVHSCGRPFGYGVLDEDVWELTWARLRSCQLLVVALGVPGEEHVLLEVEVLWV